MKKIAGSIVLLACLAGCASPVTQQEKQNLAAPINCATAQVDIKNLTSEKARISTEIENGVTSIVPIGAVVHLFSKDEVDSFKVGTGQYNRAIDKKIAEIKQQCNVH
jgi:hypothetical protein